MKSVPFEEVNAKIAEHQDEYETLHANIDPYSPGVPTTICLQLTDEEIAEIIINKNRVYLTQLTNGRAYTPFRMSFTKPEMIKHDLTKYKR